MIPRGPELDAETAAAVDIADVLDQLDEHMSGLGIDELRVLERIAKRLRMGQEQYGRLRIAEDRRDWREEGLQEALDLAVYLSIAGLK